MGRYAPVIERLEKADGPDRELDMLIFEASGKPLPTKMLEQRLKLEWDSTERTYLFPVGDDMRVRYEHPRYTASLDAAISLVDRKLPGWRVDVVTGGVPRHVGSVSDPERDWSSQQSGGHKSSAAIALLIAMLCVLEVQEEDKSS